MRSCIEAEMIHEDMNDRVANENLLKIILYF